MDIDFPRVFTSTVCSRSFCFTRVPFAAKYRCPEYKGREQLMLNVFYNDSRVSLCPKHKHELEDSILRMNRWTLKAESERQSLRGD